MPVKKLIDFLDSNKAKYVVINHSPAYTAREVAASAHIPRREFAKAVMVRLNGNMAIAVVPASHRVDLESLAKASSVDSVRLASESEFADCFPGCDVGAMPPFGNLYGMETFVATSLAEDEQIAFNAGTHMQLIEMAYADYARLVGAKVFEFSVKQ